MGGWNWDGDTDARGLRREQNALRQYDRLVELIRQHLNRPDAFALTPKILCELNGLATTDETENPGVFRRDDVWLPGIKHEPPPWQEVPGLVDELCAYVNESDASAVHLAAYVLWRVNWVHPFEDGNGRTARAASYLVLCVRLGLELPGNPTVPDLISTRYRFDHNDGLEAADRAAKRGEVELSQLESVLESALKQQLSAS